MKSKLFITLILWELFAIAIVGQVSPSDLETGKRGLILLGAATLLFALVLIFRTRETRPRWFGRLARHNHLLFPDFCPEANLELATSLA